MKIKWHFIVPDWGLAGWGQVGHISLYLGTMIIKFEDETTSFHRVIERAEISKKISACGRKEGREGVK